MGSKTTTRRLMAALSLLFASCNGETENCDTGWKKRDDSCYKTSATAGWWSAEAGCSTFGGNLPSLRSEEETRFIAAQFLTTEAPVCWLGFNRAKSVDTWSDGSAINYGSEKLDTVSECAALTLFADVRSIPCTSSFLTLCKKKAPLKQIRERYLRVEMISNSRMDLTPKWTYAISNEKRCAARCLGEVACVGFSYNEGSGACLIYDNGTWSSDKRFNSSQWRLWGVVYREQI